VSAPPAATEPAAPIRRTQVPLGILFMIGATVMFACSNAATKWLVASYPVGEILFTRNFTSFISIALFLLPQAGFSIYRTRHLGAHVIRAVSQTASQTCIILAFSLMPLASAVAISFSAPLFATLAAAIALKETVGAVRWAALLVGFLGVLVVSNPGAETFQLGALYALGNAVLYGTVTAGVRGMTKTESTNTLLIYQVSLLTIAYGCMLPLGVEVPTLGGGALMVLNGTTNAFGQYWWTRALHLAPASAVTPFYYFMMVWAIVLGFVIWGDVPTLSLLGGSAIVVASGLFLLYREARRAAEAKRP
jgi:drug/metabolite transporter (DMT)-like permease